MRLNDDDLALLKNYFRYVESAMEKPVNVEPSEFVRNCIAFTVMWTTTMPKFLESISQLQIRAQEKFEENIRAGKSSPEQIRDMGEYVNENLLPEFEKRMEEALAFTKNLTGKRRAGAKKKKKRHTPGPRSRKETSL